MRARALAAHIERKTRRTAYTYVCSVRQSALDAHTENFLTSQLPVLARGRTVILVTHREALAALADRVLVLEEGCLVQQGRPELLARLSGPYQRLWQRATLR